MTALFIKGDIISSLEITSMWATDTRSSVDIFSENYIGQFGPNQIGIVLERSIDSKVCKILINNGLQGWIFSMFIKHV